MFKFSVWDFSDKEINQIVDLVKTWASGSTNPIDRRKYTKDALYWAERYNLIELGENIKSWDYKSEKEVYPWYVLRGGANRYYTTHGKDFEPFYNLPIEAMWRMAEPMLEKSKGYSITKSKEWRNFGIYCAQDSYFNKMDEYEKKYGSGAHLTYGQTKYIPYMRNILGKLANYGYIIFQYAGTVWQVTLTLDRAYRSE